MGEPALKVESTLKDDTQKWSNKKVQVAGFTEGLREKEVERLKKKMSKKGWELVEYNDDGMSKSHAVFRRPIDYKEPSSGFLKYTGHFFLFTILFSMFNNLHYYVNVIMFSVSVFAIFYKKFNELYSSKPVLKTGLKHLAFAFGFAIFGSYGQYQLNQEVIDQTDKVTKILEKTRTLISEKKFDEAKNSLKTVIGQNKANNIDEAKKLHKELVRLNSKSMVKNLVMGLSELNFKKLLDKNLELKIVSNPIINSEVISKMQVIAPKIKNEFYKGLKQKKVAAAKDKAEKERLAKEQAKYDAIITKIGPKPENSGWDGSVRPAKKWLESNLKDPDSLKDEEWYQVRLVELNGNHYWHTAVKYRAKNSFGAYILGAHEFYIQNGYVVKANSLQ